MDYVKNDAQWAMITLGMMIRVEGIEPVMENRTKIPANLISCTERLCGVKMTPERIATRLYLTRPSSPTTIPSATRCGRRRTPTPGRTAPRGKSISNGRTPFETGPSSSKSKPAPRACEGRASLRPKCVFRAVQGYFLGFSRRRAVGKAGLRGSPLGELENVDGREVEGFANGLEFADGRGRLKGKNAANSPVRDPRVVS